MGVKLSRTGSKWGIRIYHNGLERKITIGTKAAAKQAMEMAEVQMASGRLGFAEEQNSIPSLKEYFDRFILEYSMLNHKDSTRDNYLSLMKNHILPEFGKKRLNEIDKKGIKSFLIRKQNTGLSTSSVRLMQKYLSAVLRQAIDDELITANPAAGTGRYITKKDTGRKPMPFTEEEMRQFEKTAFECFPRYYPLFICALRTGMRLGELTALKPEDIHFDRGCISVMRNLGRKGRIDLPKGNRTRIVDMTDNLETVLRRYLTQRKKEALAKGRGRPPEWLFYNENGSLINHGSFRTRVFHKCLANAGLEKRGLHDLRHTYATLRIQAGDNIADVSRQLGHADIKTTINTYYHWIPGKSREEISKLDGYGYMPDESVKKTA